MTEQEDLLSGMIFYQNHDYLNALKHFNRNADKQTNEVTQMVFEGLSAITNMQLCNYNQASQQFNDLRARISSWERNQPEPGRASEIQLLKVKVLANLIIIQLLNGMEIRDGLLDELMETIQSRYNNNHQTGKALLKALLRSLLGFESFSSLENQIQQTLQEIQKSERSKNKLLKENKALSVSPIFLSSLSVYSHLKGNLKIAITLQQISLSLTKGNNTVAAVLSLRHLQRLYQQSSNDKMKRNSRQQLMSLMSSDQFEGVAEETLFRNYNSKIQIAQFLIQQLASKQAQFNEQIEQDSNEIIFIAVSWKMKRMRNGTNYEKINATLQMIQKDKSIISVMGQSQFIRQALAEYYQGLENLKEVLNVISYNYFSRQFITKLQSFPPKQKQKRIIDIDLLQYQQNDKNQKPYISNRTQKVHTPNRMKKHTFETSLYIVDKNKVLKTESEFEQDNGVSLNQSRLSVRPSASAFMNKHQQKNLVYLNERQKQKGVFKIAKDDTKKSGIRQQQKEVVRSQKVQRSKSRNQTEVKPRNSIQQFMKTQIIASNPKPKQEKSFLSAKQENNKTSNLLLKKQEDQVQKIVQKPIQPVKEKIRQKPIQKIIQVEKEKPAQIPKQSQINVKQTESNSSLPKVSQLISKTFQFVPLKSSTIQRQKPFGKGVNKQKFYELLHKIVKRCQFGQYVEKRHLTSDGGDERYFKINTKKDYFSLSQKKDSDENEKQYKFSTVKGIVIGKVTPNMIKECNHKLQPWRCISFILQNRTLDLYCNDFSDMKFIVPGVSLFLKELSFKSEQYYIKKMSTSKVQRSPRGQFQFGHKLVKRHYSLGRLLWKKFLLRLQWQHQKGRKKEKRNPYFCSGAYAIVAAAVKKCNYWPTVIKRKIV